MAALGQFFDNPAVTTAMQAALLETGAPAVQAAAVQLVSTLAGTSVGLAQCCFIAAGPVVTELLLRLEVSRQLHSNRQDTISSSSSCCKALGALSMPAAVADQHAQQLTVQQAGGGAAALAEAARKMWALLLQRVSSKQLLGAEVGDLFCVVLGWVILLQTASCSAGHLCLLMHTWRAVR